MGWKAVGEINTTARGSDRHMDQGIEVANHFGDGAFVFEPWETPFENSDIELIGVEYSESGALVIRVRIREAGSIYRVCFEHVSAFRVLDEHGLLELWEKSEERGDDLPAQHSGLEIISGRKRAQSPLSRQMVGAMSFQGSARDPSGRVSGSGIPPSWNRDASPHRILMLKCQFDMPGIEVQATLRIGRIKSLPGWSPQGPFTVDLPSAT
jgi:hypothetical protein